MKKFMPLLILGIVAYFCFLVVNFPAAQAYGLIKKVSPDTPLILKGIQGSVWQGSATQAYVAGQSLSSFTWDLNPLWLLIGRVQADLGLRNGESYLYAQVGRSLGNNIYLEDVEARLNVADIHPLMKKVPANLEGVISIKLETLSLEDQDITMAEGIVAWQDAAFRIAQPVNLGHIKIDLENTAEGVKGTVSDGGGALAAAGTLQLAGDGTWQFAGNFAARDQGQQGLTQALGFLGRPGADGRITVSNKGKLSDLGGPFAPAPDS